MPPRCDVVVVGGGIVGLATAMALARRRRVAVLEAEAELASHQTGRNSGVIHSGLYYRPGSRKARTCSRGRLALERFCDEAGVDYERCGKLVVATSQDELTTLDRLAERGSANGLDGIVRVRREEIGAYEPCAAGIGALFVPQTGIVDYSTVAGAFASRIRATGGEIATSSRVIGIRRRSSTVLAETAMGAVEGRVLVNCAGLQSDRVARLAGVDPGVRIVPFRGEYFEVAEDRSKLVRNLIYPVPDPRFPFLGVHFTRRIDGTVEAGPNAVLALRREGYTKTSFSVRDAASTLTYPGFWRLARRYLATGLGEMARSWSKAAFVSALRRLVPDIRPADLIRGGAGVRAQALAPDGRLVDDFHVVRAERQVHVLNAPSPAATASIAIGEEIAALVEAELA